MELAERERRHCILYISLWMGLNALDLIKGSMQGLLDLQRCKSP